MKNKLVSVIIPTYNASRTLKKCLESLKNQIYNEIEVIVVDNASKDNTKDIANEYTSKVYNIGPERSAQRNFGAKKSIGSYLFFIDQDMILKPDVIRECVAKTDKFNALIVPEISFGDGFWAKCKALERSLYIENDNVELTRFFERNFFFELKGYDESLTGPEDYAINNEIIISGTPIGRINEVMLHDEGRLTLKKLIKKRIHYGKHFGKYAMKYPYFAKKQVGIQRIRSLLKPKIFKTPVYAVGMLLMKSCEFAANSWGMFIGEK